MVMTIAGPPLANLAGQAQPRREIAGPGPEAFKMIPQTDVTTWLVSPGVCGCAILTIVLRTTRTGGTIIGERRVPVGVGFIRAMAHFNPFSGPRVSAIKLLFDQCRVGQNTTVNDLAVAISFHARATPSYHDELVTVVGQAVPALNSLTTHGYGSGQERSSEVNAPARRGAVTLRGRNTKPITIYLSPTGGLSASQEQ